ncbi:unnamed protein product, partial [Callosobruchus maculatus]
MSVFYTPIIPVSAITELKVYLNLYLFSVFMISVRGSNLPDS